MQMRTLPGTPITTSVLGLGWAGLFRLPRREQRAAVVRAALAAGIRHFDTAPMYGLGRSEAELAPFLSSHRDELTVTTKFGIETSALGRAAGRLQGPIRSALARRPGLQHMASAAGSGPSDGTLGRLIYTSAGYDAERAAQSLDRSLRALGTEYIDIFALHDPMGAVVTDVPELVAYLDQQVRAGTIRAWGVAGAMPPAGSDGERLLSDVMVVQHHDDVFTDPTEIAADRADTDRAVISFGCLSRALPALLRYLAAPDNKSRWSERFGTTLDDETVAGFLLREAVRRNRAGVVLFSTTRPERIGAAVDAVAQPADPAEITALHDLVAEVHHRTHGSA